MTRRTSRRALVRKQRRFFVGAGGSLAAGARLEDRRAEPRKRREDRVQRVRALRALGRRANARRRPVVHVRDRETVVERGQGEVDVDGTVGEDSRIG